jgi:DedD protein
MNNVLKQRLVGALILVALGVVFWPIIFVEPGEQGGAEEARIPQRPQVDTTPVETPGMVGLRPSPEQVKEQPAPDRPLLTLAPESPPPTTSGTAAPEPVKKTAVPVKKTRTEPPVKPVIDDQGVPVVWILRVASVSSSSRADELRKRLLEMGYKAYTKKIKSGDKTLYRVYVGPKAEKAKLAKIQPQIDAEFGVTSMISRYYP